MHASKDVSPDGIPSLGARFLKYGNTTRRVALKETLAPVLAFRTLFATSD